MSCSLPLVLCHNILSVFHYVLLTYFFTIMHFFRFFHFLLYSVNRQDACVLNNFLCPVSFVHNAGCRWVQGRSGIWLSFADIYVATNVRRMKKKVVTWRSNRLTVPERSQHLWAVSVCKTNMWLHSLCDC